MGMSSIGDKQNEEARTRWCSLAVSRASFVSSGIICSLPSSQFVVTNVFAAAAVIVVVVVILRNIHSRARARTHTHRHGDIYSICIYTSRITSSFVSAMTS